MLHAAVVVPPPLEPPQAARMNAAVRTSRMCVLNSAAKRRPERAPVYPGCGGPYHLWDGRERCDHRPMSLGKMLVVILGLAATAFAVRAALTGTIGTDPAVHSAPRRQLDSVRERARAL